MSEICRLIFDFCSSNRVLTLLHCIIIASIPLRDVLLPLQYTRLITCMQKGEPFVRPLVFVTMTLVAIQVVDLLSDYCDTYILSRLQTFVRRRLLVNLFSKYQNSIADIETGDITTKMIKLPQVITLMFERIHAFFVPHFMLHVGALLLMCYTDWQLGCAMMLATAAFYAIMIWSTSQCNRHTTARDEQFAALHEEIDDILRNLYSVYGGNQIDEELRNVDKIGDQFDSAHRKATVCAFKLRSLIYPIMIGFVVFVMLRVTRIMSHKRHDIQRIIPVFFVLMSLMNSFMSFDDNMKHIVLEWGVLTSGKELLKRPERSAHMTKHPRSQGLSHGIGMRDVDFQYPKEPDDRPDAKRVLTDVNMHVHPGETLAIMGDVGCGKSTILKLLLGYYYPTSGEVYFEQRAYGDWDAVELRRRIGYVPQTPVLFKRSIYDNIVYGTCASQERIRTLLHDLQLHDMFADLPDGLNTSVGKNGSHLSGGQRQLVWCARVILQDPDIIVLDEPTAAMDTHCKTLLKSIMWHYFVQKGKTIIMVTHDTELSAFATRRIIVDNGSVRSDTSPSTSGRGVY
jgi:ABC-type multidrug transport system fused ATPase/permease subunit